MARMFAFTRRFDTAQVGPPHADDTSMTATPEFAAVEPVLDSTADEVVVVPCAARPSTGFVHLDGPCRCFAGGPPPEFAPAVHLERRAG
jgi:hypothetical protein